MVRVLDCDSIGCGFKSHLAPPYVALKLIMIRYIKFKKNRNFSYIISKKITRLKKKELFVNVVLGLLIMYFSDCSLVAQCAGQEMAATNSGGGWFSCLVPFIPIAFSGALFLLKRKFKLDIAREAHKEYLKRKEACDIFEEGKFPPISFFDKGLTPDDLSQIVNIYPPELVDSFSRLLPEIYRLNPLTGIKELVPHYDLILFCAKNGISVEILNRYLNNNINRLDYILHKINLGLPVPENPEPAISLLADLATNSPEILSIGVLTAFIAFIVFSIDF